MQEDVICNGGSVPILTTMIFMVLCVLVVHFIYTLDKTLLCLKCKQEKYQLIQLLVAWLCTIWEVHYTLCGALLALVSSLHVSTDKHVPIWKRKM